MELLARSVRAVRPLLALSEPSRFTRIRVRSFGAGRSTFDLRRSTFDPRRFLQVLQEIIRLGSLFCGRKIPVFAKGLDRARQVVIGGKDQPQVEVKSRVRLVYRSSDLVVNPGGREIVELEMKVAEIVVGFKERRVLLKRP